jgi:hypothetical protein
MRDRPVAETSTWQRKHSQETNIHVPRGIRTRDPSKRSAADLRLRSQSVIVHKFAQTVAVMMMMMMMA